MKRLCQYCTTWYVATERETEPVCMTCLMRQHAHNVLSVRPLGIRFATNLSEEGLQALEAAYQANIDLYE